MVIKMWRVTFISDFSEKKQKRSNVSKCPFSPVITVATQSHPMLTVMLCTVQSMRNMREFDAHYPAQSSPV